MPCHPFLLENNRRLFTGWISRWLVLRWSAGDEELDLGNLGDELSKHSKDGGLWFPALALVEPVDNNHSRNFRALERPDEKFLHLAFKRLVCDVWVQLMERDKPGSEAGVLQRKQEGQCREDELEVTAILNTSRAEEGRAQTVINKQPFCNGLGNGSF